MGGVALTLVGGFFAGHWVGQAGSDTLGNHWTRSIRQVGEQPQASEALHDATPQWQTERARRDGERLLEFATRQHLERKLEQQESEIARLRARLAVYEQLLPAGPQGTISLRNVNVTRLPNALRYQALLMRSGNTDGQLFEGRLSFVAEGKRAGKSETLTLTALTGSPLVDEADELDLEITFDRYLRVQGLLAVPEGFELDGVTLNVLEDGMVRASRSVAIDF